MEAIRRRKNTIVKTGKFALSSDLVQTKLAPQKSMENEIAIYPKVECFIYRI